MRSDAAEYLYLYCLARTMPALQRVAECAESGIQCVHAKGIYAVVSRVSSVEFDEGPLKKNLSDMKWVEAKVLRHEKVIEGIMRNCTVIPFKFATIFKTEENLLALLHERCEDFNAIFDVLDGREEWGVKMHCNRDLLKATVMEEVEQLINLEREINASPIGKMYFLKKKREKLVEDVLDEKIIDVSAESFKTLREQSCDARICTSKPLRHRSASQSDEVILDAAFLVDKMMLDRFIGGVQSLRERYGGRGLTFYCTGPWPPYNFCA